MPKHGAAIAWRLADVGGRKKRNVRSDEFLRDVQKAVVADESHPERIIGDEFSTKMLGPLLWVLGLQPFDVVLRFAHERLIQHVSKHRETVSFITGYRVEHFNPRNYCLTWLRQASPSQSLPASPQTAPCPHRIRGSGLQRQNRLSSRGRRTVFFRSSPGFSCYRFAYCKPVSSHVAGERQQPQRSCVTIVVEDISPLFTIRHSPPPLRATYPPQRFPPAQSCRTALRSAASAVAG